MTASPVEFAPFDLFGPLPRGATVLEASAGTGKTYTIAALVTRLVAEEGVDLRDMLIVTFGRAATSELRERVRERLTSAATGLAAAGSAAEVDDPLLAHLRGAPPDEVARRRHRLGQALVEFDAATIATTHQFCAQVLAGLGVAADLAGGDRFVESLDELVTEVAGDLYLRKFAAPSAADDAPRIPPAEALAIAHDCVLREPQARLEPAAAPADTPAGVRRRLADAVRTEVARRKELRGLRSYDDLQTELARELCHPQRGAEAVSRLRQRFAVVLIDEFQDTDPVQWDIVRTAFLTHGRLVLIGDPKQAIYGFRGADVTAYLRAVKQATTVATLEHNWRSEGALLEAFDLLFADCTFGDSGIRYRSVQAARRDPALLSPPVAEPLRLRLVTRDDGAPLSAKGLLTVKELRPQVAADVADDITRLLRSGAQVLDPDRGEFGPVEPGHVAVLVRANYQAELVQAALRERGVPAVIGGTQSVFTTPVAADWLTLLEALEQPFRLGRVKAAAMSCFLGWSAERVALASQAETDALTGLVRAWANVLAGRGVAALQESIVVSQGLPARLLAEGDGERRLTDLRHIGEALHAAAAAEGLGIAALVGWLRGQIAEADTFADGLQERSRRLDSDADAVQVVTVHRSKGLEFPIVYVPFAWDENQQRVDRPRYHDASGERVLDVGGGMGGASPSAFHDGLVRHQTEEAGEQLRLLYVAVTRARSQVVLWWAPATTAECAPLTRLLLGERLPGGEPERLVTIPGDAEIRKQVEARAAGRAGRLAVEDAFHVSLGPWDGRPRDSGQLSTARFDRELDLGWRRTSYSALTAAAHEVDPRPIAESAVGSEPEDVALDDEPDSAGAWAAGAAAHSPETAGVVSPMAELPGGTAFGSLVHGVFETVDPSVADLSAEVADRLSEQLGRWMPGSGPGSAIDRDRLRDALLAVYETPLGPAADGLRLRDFGLRDRLTELGFELPLAGGDRPPGDELTLAALGPVLDRHLTGAAPADPLASYSERLRDPLLRSQPLRGYLNGSLDAVLRLGDAPGSGSVRYLVVDYKTNWLGTSAAGSGQLTAADYTPDRLTAAMLESDYPLQALLYSVALHRYLRWRQPGYHPESHLGGVLYLYVRGMCGAETPMVDGRPCGVFAWQPPAAMVVELSDLLDAGEVGG